jgi:hypothetical protein
VTGNGRPCEGKTASCVTQGDDELGEGDGGPGEGGGDPGEGDGGPGGGGGDGGGDRGPDVMGDEGATEETIGNPVIGGVNSPADVVQGLGEDNAASLEGNRGEAMGEAACDGSTGAGCSEGSSSSSRRAP